MADFQPIEDDVDAIVEIVAAAPVEPFERFAIFGHDGFEIVTSIGHLRFKVAQARFQFTQIADGVVDQIINRRANRLRWLLRQ